MGITMGLTAAERQRISRDRKSRYEIAFAEFLTTTPFSSQLSDSEKRQQFNNIYIEKPYDAKKLKITNQKKSLPISVRDRVKKCREKKKKDNVPSNLTIENKEVLNNYLETKLNCDNKEFEKKIGKESFGVVCSVCDRLWFQNDLKSIPLKAIELLQSRITEQSKIPVRRNRSLST